VVAGAGGRGQPKKGKVMIQFLLVFIGGGIGAAIRHGINLGTARLASTDFPVSTMFINISGSLLMGLMAAWFAFRAGQPGTQNLRLLLTTGVLGGYTTFSTFSLEAALLWERGAPGQAAVYVLGSVALSILGLFLGLWLVRSLG
jgi:CrcB protein